MPLSIEDFVGTRAGTIAGDGTFIGLLLLGLFFGFVLIQRTSLDTKLAILVPAAILSMVFFSAIFRIVFVLLAGGILYLAYKRFTAG